MADDNTQTEVVKPKYPARLDIVDMPRDKGRALGGLRQAICASFNYCRKYPAKMETLRNVLVYVLERIDSLEGNKEDATKLALEKEGKKLGIDLDRRKSVDNLIADLEAHKAKLAAEKAKANEAKATPPKAPEKATTAAKTASTPAGGDKVSNNS